MKQRTFEWPKKGNKAFVAPKGGKSFHIERLAWHWPQHAQAFKLAAELVVDAYEEADRRLEYDELFYPVAYLYRHCVELRLKDIITTGLGMHFFKKADVKEAMENHNLARLWNHAKKLLKDRWKGADETPLKAVESVINELHQVDPTGQAFRFDADKSGRRFRHDKLPTRVSLKELRKTMDGVFTFLDATASELHQNLSDMMDNMPERE